MRPAVRRAFGVGLVVLGLVAVRVAARHQVPAPSAPATAAISGVVMDGATGKPIGGARVTFWSNVDPSNIHSMLTDPQGRFVFLRLPQSSGCNVIASKSGYADGGLTRTIYRLSADQPAIALKQGEWVSNVRLTLWRHGGISGRVIDEMNEPVVGIPVRALRVILAADTWRDPDFLRSLVVGGVQVTMAKASRRHRI